MNVIKDPWIPVIRKDGTRENIPPYKITSKPNNPIIALDFGRPDFNAVGVRLLIGFFNTYLAPTSKKEWKKLFKKAPNQKAILEKLKPKLFELDGKGPRFLQDKRPQDLERIVNVGNLLFDTPGTATIKAGKDFFQKAKIHTFCQSCATIALYLNQLSAIMGGQGYRTSITAGANGSLTTIITGSTLWETIWSNVIIKKTMFEFGGNPKGVTLPWLSDTVDSKNKATVSLDEMNPYYPLWEMPLRIHLIFDKFDESCTICGNHSKLMVRKIKTRNYGNCYVKPRHILSPIIKGKETGFRKPLDFTSHLDLVTYLLPAKKLTPALVVSHFMENREYLGITDFGLWTFGYNMAKAKLFGWEENKFDIPEELYKDSAFTLNIREHSYLIGWYTCNYIRKFWGTDKTEPLIFHEFLTETEEYFYEVLKNHNIEKWLEKMVVKAFDTFEKNVGTEKRGLQKYFKEQFIETLNKKVVKPLKLQPLEYENFAHIEYRKLNLPHFNQVFTKPFLSWYGTIRNTEKHRVFTRCFDIDILKHEDLYLNFILEMSMHFPALRSEDMKTLFVPLLLIVFKAKDLDFSQSFGAQMGSQKINRRHVDEMMSFNKTDIQKNWKVFADVVSRMEGFNIISFMEGYAHWSKDVKFYWEREYSNNI